MKFNFKILQVLFLLLTGFTVDAQTILNADNIGNNTYELINSVLALGYTAVETPDQFGGGHETGFGRHIAEVYDADLGKNVFEFYIHVTPDLDVSTTHTDRQRVEIKTYASSPANLIGTSGEIVQYKWRFKIPTGFQPSSTFTHIHQVKAVDGDDSDPIFTLTVRKGTPNKIELIYVKDQFSATDKKQIVDLSSFEGVWVEATETITIGINGTYSMSLDKVSDHTNLLFYSNNNIQTIRSDNSFIRPKWGIYRSIATPTDLRDESLRLSDISINELSSLPVVFNTFSLIKNSQNIMINWSTASEINLSYYAIESAVDGKNFSELAQVKPNLKNGDLNYSYKDVNPKNGTNYYKVVSFDLDGKTTVSAIKAIDFGLVNPIAFYPNPSTNQLNFKGILNGDRIRISDLSGKIIINKFNQEGSEKALNVHDISDGTYLLNIERNGVTIFNQKWIKQ